MNNKLTDHQLCQLWLMQTEEYGLGKTMFFYGKNLYTIKQERLVGKFIKEKVIFILDTTDTLKYTDSFFWTFNSMQKWFSQYSFCFEVTEFNNHSRNIQNYKNRMRKHIREREDKKHVETTPKALMEQVLDYTNIFSIPLDNEIIGLVKTIFQEVKEEYKKKYIPHYVRLLLEPGVRNIIKNMEKRKLLKPYFSDQDINHLWALKIPTNQFIYALDFSPPSSKIPGNLEIKIVHKKNNSDFITLSWKCKKSNKGTIEHYGCRIECNHKTLDLLRIKEILKKLKINSSTTIQNIMDALHAYNIKPGVHIKSFDKQYFSGIISKSEIYNGQFLRAGKEFTITRKQQISLLSRRQFLERRMGVETSEYRLTFYKPSILLDLDRVKCVTSLLEKYYLKKPS